MAMIDINWNPSARELRQFGGLCILFFGGLSAWAWFGHESQTWATIAGTAAVVLGGLGLVAPNLLRWVFVGWIVAAFPIGWTISHFLMGFIYFVLMTPMAFLMSMVGRDPMERGFDPKAKTYWSTHEKADDVSHYFRQF
ncbi:MAG: hypothetical protein ACI8TX_001110 [Hyphomicrobiaceae bacterium]|jgi:hypothetical protein